MGWPLMRLLIIRKPPSLFHCGAIWPTPLKVTRRKLLARVQMLPLFCLPLVVVVYQGLQYYSVGNFSSFRSLLIQKIVPE